MPVDDLTRMLLAALPAIGAFLALWSLRDLRRQIEKRQEDRTVVRLASLSARCVLCGGYHDRSTHSRFSDEDGNGFNEPWFLD